ncbi:MAG: hypothetical protein EKK33_32720 [Bradyrhizobiaceae bacterium]|nr:MAG: hypothetical protein EKK33_32720 [Bradyrhizobiaceae bacterium]
MAPIDRQEFAAECIKQGNEQGAWAHYLVAVAELRSKIDDGETGDKIGPFRLTQVQWNAHRAADNELGLEADDIKSWFLQCVLFASWTHNAHRELVTATGESPTSKDIYAKQFPDEPVDGFDKALTDTSGLMPAGQTVATSDAPVPSV